MHKMRIPLFKVFMPDDMGKILQRDVFDKGMLTEGEWSDKFEAQVAELVENPYTALVNSCTSALTLAYRLCGIGQGDKVITTPMTCMATNEPLYNVGAQLVWADIDRTTGNIGDTEIYGMIKRHPDAKAVVMTLWGGEPSGVLEVTKRARRAGMRVVLDCAHALGARYDDVSVANYGDFACFSFQAIKHMTTGDGGALSCNNKLDFEEAKLIRWFGIDRKYPGSKWKQDIRSSGYKFHMNNINARIGVEQMKYVRQIVGTHRKNSEIFDGRIENPVVKKLRRDQKSTSSCWLYTLKVDNVASFKEHMDRARIDVDPVHIRNDQYKVFDEFCGKINHGVNDFTGKMVNIPVGWWLSQEDRERIIEAVNSYEV